MQLSASGTLRNYIWWLLSVEILPSSMEPKVVLWHLLKLCERGENQFMSSLSYELEKAIEGVQSSTQNGKSNVQLAETMWAGIICQVAAEIKESKTAHPDATRQLLSKLVTGPELDPKTE